MNNRFVKEGRGWRLGWDAAAPEYKGLLAGQSWAIELTAAEFEAFRRLVLDIKSTMDAIAAELMDDERIACEAEADYLWVEAEGLPNAYGLRFILTSGRSCEGSWDAIASQSIIEQIAHLEVF
ncbi:DUF1818 family protein [Nodosilinea sp. E11]|uniref:DUF1818 family protein n=1 Tax=Nodosilinea sp. E11 TaxID=3037479 RepID=UPI002934CB09|nr:DUF1818 family protein [Nodosilinea sp. E11]WOD38761.1 DUF1818 family protein [Nodosilinea sp. E11]